MKATKESPTQSGERSYRAWQERFFADAENRRIYEEEAAKKELWLQLVEAREQAGLTRAQLGARLGVSEGRVSRIERRGYDACTLAALRRYVEALGAGFRLDVRVCSQDTRGAGVL